MKKVRFLLSFVLCIIFSLSLISCGAKSGDDGEFDDDGNYKPSTKGSVVNFLGWGTDEEGKVFEKLKNDFNNTIGKEKNIKVEYELIPSNSYDSALTIKLAGDAPPDVVYVGDGKVKTWADLGYLTRLDDPADNFLEKNGGMDFDVMWDSAVNRYRYNTETTTSDNDDPLWGTPKDIGPTVIYYNETYMKNAGITIISVPENEIAGGKFNQTIPGTAKTYSYKGYDGTQKVFNNRIAMSWEETVELAKLLKKDKTPQNSNCQWGFFTEWWFSYGWGVGGDCMEYILDADGNPYYEFTLGDETKNYIVKDELQTTFTISSQSASEREYKPGEIISYADKKFLTSGEKSTYLNELPSQREAFIEFCRLSAPVNWQVDGAGTNGYDVAMNPTVLGNSDYSSYFSNGSCAMYIGGRWAVTTHRKYMSAGYAWDVAPLPVYKSYNPDGTVKAHGISSGHSGSAALSIPKKSKQKNAAWVFMQYISGEVGQSAQSKEGFCIPNQKHLAEDDEIFLQSAKSPKNSIIFLDAAKNQRPADWTYLKDREWINIWADPLNQKVRDAKMTITELFASTQSSTQNKLYTYNKYTPR